ncbi:MAG: DUF4153 domain-containing protein [Actinomycetota bacterium]
MSDEANVPNFPLGADRSWDLAVRVPADRRVLGTAVAVAIATDLTWKAGPATVAATLLVVVVSAGMLASRRVMNPQAALLVGLAPPYAVWLAFRASPWLVLPDLAVVIALLVFGASLRDRGSLFDLGFRDALRRTVHAATHVVAAAPFAVAAARQIPFGAEWVRTRSRELVRGALLATPIVVVVGSLLASADAVFASFFDIDVALAPALRHVVSVTVGFLAMSGLLRAYSAAELRGSPAVRPLLGSVEMIVVLGPLCGVLATFAVAQLVALSTGGRRVIETSGLTYAEYARSGFFQLVAVAAITLAVVLVVRSRTDLTTARTRRAFLLLSAVALALTMGVVVVAVRRMDLYEQAYGLTMLRLYVRVFTLSIGAILAIAGLRIAGVGGHRRWGMGAAVTLGLAALLALNAINPEALVVRRNMAHATGTRTFDAAYAAGLSADAVPALVEVLPRLDPVSRGALRDALCRRAPADGEWLSWNRSTKAADASLATAC